MSTMEYSTPNGVVVFLSFIYYKYLTPNGVQKTSDLDVLISASSKESGLLT